MLIHIFAFPLLFTSICLFPFLSHPLAMGLNLLVITITMALFCGLMFSSYWISYTLVLVLLGGLLVIFIYVALLAANEMFSLSNSSWIIMSIALVMSMSVSLFFSPSLLSENHNVTSLTPFTMSETLSPLFNQSAFPVTLFLVCYLFLTLIVVVSNIKNHFTPLRSQT